jgi:hypothetical protein
MSVRSAPNNTMTRHKMAMVFLIDFVMLSDRELDSEADVVFHWAAVISPVMTMGGVREEREGRMTYPRRMAAHCSEPSQSR